VTDYQKRLDTAIANSMQTHKEEEERREAIKILLESPTQERTATSSTPPAEAQQKQNANERSANPQPEQQRSTGSASVETSKAPPAPKSSTASVNMQPAENKTDKNSTPSASHQTPKASTDNTASVPKPAPASVSASVSAQVEAPKFLYHSPQLLKSLKLVLRSPKSIEPEVFTFKLESGFTSLEVLLDSKQNQEPVPDLLSTSGSDSDSASTISESPEEIDLVEEFDLAESIDEQPAPAVNAHAAPDPTNLPLRFPDELRDQLRKRMVDVNLDPVKTALDDSMLLSGFDLNDNTHEEISKLLETFKNIPEPTLANMQERWNSIVKYVAEREGSAHLWIYLTKVFVGILEHNLDTLPENATITLSNASPAANTPEEFTIPINAFIDATNLITSHSEKLWYAGRLRVGESMASPVLSEGHWTTYILKRPSENEYEVTMIDSLGNGQISKRTFTGQQYDQFSTDMQQINRRGDRSNPIIVYRPDTISSDWSSAMRIGAGNAESDTSGLTPFTQNGNTCHFYSVVNAINYFAHDFTQNTAR
jgi:hypothetical protein